MTWWLAFRDPILAQLEDRVAAQNLDVQTATARLFQSRAQLGTAAAAGLPTLNGQGSVYRQQFSKNGTIGLLSTPSAASRVAAAPAPPSSDLTAPLTNGFESYTLGFDASWELDLWGRSAGRWNPPRAQADAAAEQRRDALVSSQAELARDYVQLRGTQEQIRIDLANIKVNEQILDVVRIRSSGVSSRASTRRMPPSRSKRSRRSCRSSPAAGVPADQCHRAAARRAAALPVAGAGDRPARSRRCRRDPRGGVPSSLVLRRPDIRRAEANLHAAGRRDRRRRGAVLPLRDAVGEPGRQRGRSGHDLPGLVPAIHECGAVDLHPALRGRAAQVEPRPPAGPASRRRRSPTRRRCSRAARRRHALAALRGDEGRRARLARAGGRCRGRRWALSRARYTQGVEIFTTVLQASQTVLQAETNLVQGTAAMSTDFVALSKALGGGWESTFPAGPTRR